MLLRIQKIAGLGSALIFVAAWFYSGFLENTFVNNPRVPVPSEAMTVPLVVKGIVVFITDKQRAILSALSWMEICFGGIAILIILIHGGDPFSSRNARDSNK